MYRYRNLGNGMVEVWNARALTASLVDIRARKQYCGPRLPRPIVRAALASV